MKSHVNIFYKISFTFLSLFMLLSCNNKCSVRVFYVGKSKFVLYRNEDSFRDDFKKRNILLNYDDSDGELFGGNLYYNYSVDNNFKYLIRYYFISNKLQGVMIKVYTQESGANDNLNKMVDKIIMPTFRKSITSLKDIVIDTIKATSNNDNRYTFFVRTFQLEKKLKK